jgi:hypothetical protein
VGCVVPRVRRARVCAGHGWGRGVPAAGFREPGFSKERRLDPHITIGLLTDAVGFPLMVHDPRPHPRLSTPKDQKGRARRFGLSLMSGYITMSGWRDLNPRPLDSTSTFQSSTSTRRLRKSQPASGIRSGEPESTALRRPWCEGKPWERSRRPEPFGRCGRMASRPRYLRQGSFSTQHHAAHAHLRVLDPAPRCRCN